MIEQVQCNLSGLNPAIRSESALHFSQLMHCMLGHIIFLSLSLLNFRELAIDIPLFQVIPQVYSIYLQSKQTRVCFLKWFLACARIPLMLIYINLWRTLPLPSLGRSKYFIFFANDHSRKTWIYFTRTKDQALHKFHEFRVMIEK